MEKPRFVLRQTPGGQLLIKDIQKDETVALIHKGQRKPEHTSAMCKVMVDALNTAVQPRPTSTQAAPQQGDLLGGNMQQRGAQAAYE